MEHNENTIVGADGTTRQHYYGEGTQPWDVMEAIGVSIEFAWGSAIKYLGREKGQSKADLEKAAWYVERMLDSEALEDLQAYAHEKLAFEWVMNVQNVERRTVLFLLLSVIGADSTKLQKELLESALERLRGMMTAEAS